MVMQMASIDGRPPGASGVLERDGEFILRPQGAWSAAVHRLLQHLEAVGFMEAPRFRGVDSRGRERLTFLPGFVGNDPMPRAYWSDSALLCAVKLLRKYHDATRSFVFAQGMHWQHQSPPDLPVEVICHNDFAPYNCVYRQGLPWGIIDFDMAAPGSRSWDLAYTLYRFVPLSCPDNRQRMGGAIGLPIAARLKLALDAYGPTTSAHFPQVVLRRITQLRDWTAGASCGNTDFAARIREEGHLEFYERDVQWLQAQQRALYAALI